jgi:hypothetical protein
MRPNTPHYVLTIKNSITIGRHMYPSSTIRHSIMGIVHTFILNYSVTNTIHHDLNTVLRRMAARWTLHYDDVPDPKCQSLHIPDLSTSDGLMDFMAMCNFLECSLVLDRGSYGKAGLHWQDKNELAMVRLRCRQLQTRFCITWKTLINRKPVHGHAIFSRSLVEFAAAIVVYKREMEPRPTRDNAGCSAEVVEGKMTSLFEGNYPELLPCFHRLVREGVVSLEWTGPPIKMSRRDAKSQSKTRETFKFDDGFNFDDDNSTVAAPIPAAVDSNVEMVDAQPLPRRSTRHPPVHPPSTQSNLTTASLSPQRRIPENGLTRRREGRTNGLDASC